MKSCFIWPLFFLLAVIVTIIVLSLYFPCAIHSLSDCSFCPGCGVQLNSVCPVCYEECFGDFCSECGAVALRP